MLWIWCTPAGMAAMSPQSPPIGVASAMAVPRVETVFRPSAKLSMPAATQAAYSPREWPAATSGRRPKPSMTRSRAMSAVSMAGWVI